MAAETISSPESGVSTAPENSFAPERPVGITFRAALLSLSLAFFFGYVIPIIDMKMRNTFLGATHFPPGAIASLLVLLLIVNPLLHMVSRVPAKVAGLGMATFGMAAAAVILFSRGLSSSGQGTLFYLLCAGAAIGLLVLSMRGVPLTRNETLTVYISCLFSCLTPGHGAENVFIVNLIGPFYYATDSNKWLEFLLPYTKPWMTPALHSDPNYGVGAKDAVGQWFQGSQGAPMPWGAWLVPLLVWGTFIFVLYTMMACLCVMMRKQWVEREALAFPLLRLPLEMTEDVDNPGNKTFSGFFGNRLMWLGFGIAVFLQTVNGLHVYYPDVPEIPMSLATGQLFTEAPWNQIGVVPVIVYPIVLGIAFLLTSEVSLSLWFFFWFAKFQLIAAYYAGFPPATLPNAIGAVGVGSKTFTFYQLIGCYLAYVGLVAFAGREHLQHIVLRALGRHRAETDERDEALSYPLAFWGFFGSFGLLVAWSIAAGMSWQLALLLWGLYLVTIIAITRIISEAGVLFVQQGWAPLGTIGQITGAGPGHMLLSNTSLPPAALLQGSLMTDLRGFIMPSFMQSFKLAHERRIALKPLLGLIMLCVVISAALGAYMNIRLGYTQGGLTLDGWYSGPASQAPALVAAGLIKGVRDASWFNMVWVGVGIVLTYGLMLARSRFAWFPLHPLGFLVSQSYPIGLIWFSIFLGWGAKVTIMRFGGTDTYRKVTPLFLGLVLGDVAMMLFWLTIDGWQGRVNHKLMPS